MEEYVIKMRRKIHEYPEIGFDLPKTVALVKQELDSFGISYTEKYGKSSIVATINEEKSNFTIGVRADMDALPIKEQTDVPYKSKIEGQMHACGHDAHTAILLDVARRLSKIKDEINCRVKLVFQAAEEYAPGGGKLMMEDGVMEDIDCIIALHCEPGCESGKIHISSGPQGAISNGFYLDFYGKSAHVVRQENGIDAITMAVKAYTSIEMMIAKELAAKETVIFNVGAFNGGHSNNIICDYCRLYCSVRSWSEETDIKTENRIKKIIEAVALESGGEAKFERVKHYPAVINNDIVSECIKNAAISVLGEDNVAGRQRTFGGEDFGFFVQKKPGAMFRLGVGNKEKDCVYPQHNDRFNIDEETLKIGSDIFIEFIRQNHNGIDFN